MLNISQVKTNNTISSPQKTDKNAAGKGLPKQSQVSDGVYPSGDLMKAMAGISTPKKTVQTSQEEQAAEINKYLHSLPITGQVISAYEQDEEGRLAVQGLVDAMGRNDVETSNVEMLLQLVEDKKVHYSALLYLCHEGVMSDEFEGDLDKLYDAYINGKDVKETFVPTMKTSDEAVAAQQVGDVFQVEGEENIYIKTSDTETKQLKMSRDTYMRLFPPLERFALYQGDAGNCYMLSTLDAMNSNPKTREKILSCFEEDGDNLHVSLPGSDYVYTMDKHRMPDEIRDYREFYSMGAAGFKILEHAYSEDVQSSLLDEAQEILHDKAENAKGFFTKRMYKKQLANLEKAMAENPSDIIFDRNISDQKISWNDSIGVEFSKLSETGGKFTRATDYYRGRGGHEEWVMQRFGFESIEKIFDLDSQNSERMQEMMFNPENENEYIFTACSSKPEEKLSKSEGLVDSDFGVYTKHSFSVKPKIDKDGNKVLHVSNPWNSSQSSVMSYEKFCELFTVVIAAKA